MNASDQQDNPTCARFKLHGGDHPRLTDAVAVADAVRGALMAQSDGLKVFSGRAADGNPLEGHVHTHIIPESLSGDGNITHVVLWAPMGFGAEAREAIQGLDRVWNSGSPQFEFQPVLLGTGQPGDFGGLNRRAGHSPALHRARRWRSRTPFVPTRHAKTYNDGRPKTNEDGLQIGSPKHDLLRLLEEGQYPEPRSVRSGDENETLQHTRVGGRTVSWDDFRTVRTTGEGRRAGSRGYGFAVEFAEPVRGPICLGYGAHYGLGRFEPAELDWEDH